MAAPTEEGEPLEKALPRIEAQIELAGGFWLGFVFSGAPQQVAALRLRTRGLLEAAGRIVVVNNLTEPEQAKEILPWLLTSSAVAEAGCTWIETSRADPPGTVSGPWTKAWDDLFLRANERRNALRERLSGGLVFAVPPEIKPRLRDAAPDLWSVRSLVIDVVDETPSRPAPSETLKRTMTLNPLDARNQLEMRQALEALKAKRAAGAEPPVHPSSRPDPGFALAEATRRAHGATASTGLALLQAAEAFLAAGRYVNARAEAARAYASLKDVDALATSRALWILGATAEAEGRRRVALDHVQQAVALRRRVAPDEVPIEWEDMAGRLAMASRDYRVAEEIYTVAQERCLRQLKTKESVGALKGLLMSLDGLGTLRREQDDLQGAATAIDQAVVVARRIRDLGADSPETLADLSLELIKLGEIRQARRDLVGAGAAIQEAVTLDQRACRLLNDAPAAMRHLSVSLNRLGDLRREVGDVDAARAAYKRALALRNRIFQANVDEQSLRDVASSLHRLGDLDVQVGDVGAAVEKFELAVKYDLARQDKNGDSPQALHDLAISLYSLGRQQLAIGNVDLATHSFEECAALAARLVALTDAPPKASALRELADAALAEIRGRAAPAAEVAARRALRASRQRTM